MASKPKNYARRVIDSRGAHFRIDTGNPQEGGSGPEVCKVYASNDNDDVFLISHSQGGLSRIACDKTLEIRSGDKNDPGRLDIRISVARGHIAINADMGNVMVRAKNVMVQAEQDIDLQAGRNVNITAGQRILMNANTVASEGKRGNMLQNTFGLNMFAGSFVPMDIQQAAFGPFASKTILGVGKAAFDSALSGGLGGFVSNSVISQTGLGGAAGGAIQSAIGGLFNG
jgi:hypothetical protein